MTAGQRKCLQFLKKYSKDLTTALADSNIFFATAVAQKCLESGYGTSELAVNYNNFGGIRGIPKYAIGKTAKGWAKFATPFDCFKSYAYFINNLEGGERYAKALAAKTPESQVYELVKAGYCTSDTPQSYLNTIKPNLNILEEKGIGGKLSYADMIAFQQKILMTEI